MTDPYRRVFPDVFVTDYERAQSYVGTTETSGVAQFGVLAMHGLDPTSYVLEYGCGALHLARVLVPFLFPEGYCAVEPNEWLTDAAFKDDADLFLRCGMKGVRIAPRDDFDASEFSHKFDFVFAHSVLSHASAAQLPEFLAHAKSVLAPGGEIIASFREGPDTNADAWTYPEATFFSWEVIQLAAAVADLTVRQDRAAQRFYMAACPDEIHDWAVFE